LAKKRFFVGSFSYFSPRIGFFGCIPSFFVKKRFFGFIFYFFQKFFIFFGFFLRNMFLLRLAVSGW